ncbi:prolyl oligopeptidase family serine peptidase [Curtobacterium sp. RRHDQ10]|uniref:S9 family peptidase n=1 Tax=Curtobacterium phyllosphaerae TaxID=3413379 RepID=UPI003BF30A7E
MTDSPFVDLDDFVRMPRTTGLVLSPDGTRLVATVSTANETLSASTDSLWEIDPAGEQAPVRITFSTEGESQPVFAADGSMLFVSKRPAPGRDTDDRALWRLPLVGEASVVASSPGGLSSPVAAGEVGAPVLVSGSRLVGSTDADEDAVRRAARKDSGVTAILHDGMPIRQWDHELGDTSARLFALRPDGSLVDLTPDAAQEYRNAGADLSADGSFVLATRTEREARGRSHAVVVRIPTSGGAAPEVIADEPGDDFGDARIAPDGSRYAVGRRTRGTYDTPHVERVEIRGLGAAVHEQPIEVDLGDVDASEYVWARDGAILFVAGDLEGAGAVLAVDPWTGRVLRRLASDASYSHLQPCPDGRWVYALRSSIDRPPTVVRLDTTMEDQEPLSLPSPGGTPELPGTLRRVAAEVDGVLVPGWLCTPMGASADDPVPLQVWIHGGPFSSWNAWSWRWCPWLAVERGYAVLLPDPALSTGYGYAAIARAWPHRASVVWDEVEALLDAVLADTSLGLDGTRTALLGASFGGYMTNWIAGHTDRFDCIVTHAGLWSLDQQHDTTDAAENKNGIFDTETDHPDWYAQNSPDRTASAISTPMLLVHGNRDYRVPVSEALRAWWDLVSGFDGPPSTMPHRLLQFTSENHWVLSPANARVWNETVSRFVDQHVRGGEPLSTRVD